MPNIKRILITFVVLGVIVIGVLFALVALSRLSCYRNTVYSQGFSQAKFAHIPLGVPQSAVLESLGAPLNTETNRGFYAWMLLNHTNVQYDGFIDEDGKVIRKDMVFMK
jgi:hypothetical protein